MKKFLLLFLTAIVCLAFVGCNSAPDKEEVVDAVYYSKDVKNYFTYYNINGDVEALEGRYDVSSENDLYKIALAARLGYFTKIGTWEYSKGKLKEKIDLGNSLLEVTLKAKKSEDGIILIDENGKEHERIIFEIRGGD